MVMMALLWRYRALLAITLAGLATLAVAIGQDFLPEGLVGVLLGGYLAYALGAAGATLLLLLLIGPLLERRDRGDRQLLRRDDR
jgi:MFS family permease